MPVIIMTGIPCSGKSTRTKELHNFFKSKNKKVDIISEEELMSKASFDRNTLYEDSKKEKLVRGDIKSHAHRLMNDSDVLIIDGSNYIKGYRYELYCTSKQYEVPDSKNRWDSPLFIVNPEDEMPCDKIFSSLFEVKAPKPNMSTQSPPVSANNYLYDMDRVTQEIVTEILSAKQMGVENNIKISKYNVILKNSASAPELAKLRRQFLTYTKMQQTEPGQVPLLFIQYLNKSL
ncbi:hypothetical protein QAD02_015726 [Eretmocerus hayati]|uniref:Uncharacterized protein n=1 Tax=Eretmocerus hayati TaxID=131215 RepID=A0ACC2PBH7_9HYME|nr:hypothetical protein QAD02_015726 [Eretmocerus hayati]